MDSGYQEPALAHLPDADGPDPFGDNEDAAAETERRPVNPGF